MNQHRGVFISYNRKDNQKLLRLNKLLYDSRNLLNWSTALGDNKFSHYYTRLTSYRLELETCKAEQHALDLRPTLKASVNTPSFSSLSRLLAKWEKEELARRHKILEDLIDVGVKLLAGGIDAILEIEFQALESKLRGVILLVDDPERFLISVSPAKLHSDVKQLVAEKIKENIKILRAKVRVLIKKIRFGFVPDLRQRFRTMMRFLFKNLDDCGDHDEVVFSLQFSLLFKNHFLNEKQKRRHSYIRELS